jgi:hypothetical protein
MHTGIDIMVPYGTPVYACKSGYVKAITTIGAELHWRVLIGDSAGTEECDALMYAHLDSASMVDAAGLRVGDWVEEGQYLGDIVYFIDIFHHIHFAKIRFAGDSADWENNGAWPYTTNLLEELDNIYDPDPPVFENAYYSQKFAFKTNGSSYYYPEGDTLDGNIDIICKIYDYINHYDWKLAPYQIEYKIEGDSSIPWTNAICFTSSLGNYSYNFLLTNVIYETDNACPSQGDYDAREYYFIITNNDGDSLIELEDVYGCWQTPYFHNGDYEIWVRARDAYGNSTVDSMMVAIANYHSLSGTITLEGSGTDFSGTTVEVMSSGQIDTTDENGEFSITDIGGGSQLMEIRRNAYIPVDTVLMMNTNQQINLMMSIFYVCGDANGDEAVNILDVVYLINFLYKGGPTPAPYKAGDVNNNGVVNLLDITYLIAYLYQGGPEPVCE